MNAPLALTPRFSREQVRELRQRTIFEHGKWDPQFGDESVLADFALELAREAWTELAGLAEGLARETLAAESELLARPELHTRLGLSLALRRALRASVGPPSLGAARVLRFDFHWTRDGWRLSEVNSDVPGGFIEASGFSGVAAGMLALERTGDPTRALVAAVRRAVGPAGTIGLVHATAYTDDRQVMVHLARALENEGLATCLLDPTQVRWNDGRARATTGWYAGPLDLLLRFYPAEWLENLPRGSDWRTYFRGSATPLSNPGAALLVQSKRFPLVWDELATPLPLWRALLTETRSPREVPWRADESWVLKPVFGRVGEDVGLRGVIEPRAWRAIERSARWHPSWWVAQRRFEAVPIPGEQGGLYPCLGVFVIDGRAAGTYGRIATRPLVDARAFDVPVLVRP